MVKIELLEISCYAYGLLKTLIRFLPQKLPANFFCPVYTLFRLSPLDCTYEFAQDECACADTDLPPRARAHGQGVRAHGWQSVIVVQLTSAKRLALANCLCTRPYRSDQPREFESCCSTSPG